MSGRVVRIDLAAITDRESFHSVFAETLGFPTWYGRNMDAWLDCLTNLDHPPSGLSAIHVEKGEILTLHLDEADAFKSRCPELFADLVECAGLVNWRRIDAGRDAIVALSFRASARPQIAARSA